MERGESSTSRARQDNREPRNPFDGITPQASVSSSAVMKKMPCDVFINHRGCDTKHKLASTIYHTLDLIGVPAFLDEKELELGDSIPEEIQEAMSTAQLHIAIFSEKYAESPWCLAELSYMLKTGTPIIPVFYHVDPSDLRWVGQEKGLYARAFSQHEKKGRYSSSMLEDWKRALERVSNLSGHVLNNTTGDEGMLLKSIVNSILRVMKKEPLEVAKHPVGMDTIVDDFERSRGKSIQTEEHGQIVGIVGFGGSGKTTLATELYNRKSSSFKCSSFLRDVRDAASKHALHTKQKKLLQDLHIQTASFDNEKDGKAFVADQLKNLCILVVLDDVDHEDQLDALLPPRESLGSGSVVIITTREGDVLTKCGITSIYKMQPLLNVHARQLFCWHAFLQPFPQKGFEDLVENCIDACNGLPLSLKVIGGQLYGKTSKDHWVSQIDKIRRILPKEILERLKVSYDALDEEEQEIFLDIACFFIGEKISTAIAVWDGSGWSGLHSWEILHNKCLVEVVHEYDLDEGIRMHDHLRDLGSQIARPHSPSRIWCEKGTPFRGITATRDCRVGLKPRDDGEHDFPDECEELLRGLLWLECFEFEHRCIPSWLSLESIRVLEINWADNLDGSGWSGLHSWETLHNKCLVEVVREFGKERIRMHDHLRDLGRKIAKTHSPSRTWCEKRTPFRGIKATIDRRVRLEVKNYFPEECEELSSEECDELSSEDCKELSRGVLWLEWSGFEHRSISSWLSLKTIRVLQITGANNLETLWEDTHPPLQLRELLIENASKLQSLPRSIGRLKHLKRLSLGINYKPTLSSLPEEFCLLRSLEHLVLRGCNGLSSLPNCFGDLVNLQHLDLSYCTRLKRLPESFKQLIHLKYLGLDGCRSLESLENIANLKSICFSMGEKFPRSDFTIRDQTSVGQLSLNFADLFTNVLPDIGQLNQLEELVIDSWESLTRLPTSLGKVSSLTTLKLKNCNQLESLPIEVGQLSSLQTLEINYCNQLHEMPSLAGLVSLNNLVVKDCYSLESLPIEVGQLSSLQTLEINYCNQLHEMPSLAGLVSLNNLVVKDCDKIKKIEGLEHLTSLEKLQVWTRWEVPGMYSLGRLERLRTLNLRADKISGFVPCIESIQLEKWPWETTICGRLFPHFQPILDSFTFPGLAVVDSFVHPIRQWSLTCRETNLSNAALVCYLVCCEDWYGGHVAREDWYGGHMARIEEGESTSVEVGEGEWIVMCVFRGVSRLVEDGGRSLRASIERDNGEVYPFCGRLMVGERGCVVEGFKKLLRTLCDAAHISSSPSTSGSSS